MVRAVTTDELLREAREAARTRNVREAVRGLALHALRGHRLTVSHIAVVARTVGRGIESSAAPSGATAREACKSAWAGLEDAVGEALQAVQIAAREFSEGQAWLAAADRDRLLADIGQLERALLEGGDYPRKLSAPLRSRIAGVRAILQAAAPAEAGTGPANGPTDAPLSLVASGVLLGLAERGGRPAPAASH
jgi:adenine-specific DNA methylase